MYFSKALDLSQSELQVQTDLLDEEKENVADDLDGMLLLIFLKEVLINISSIITSPVL